MIELIAAFVVGVTVGLAALWAYVRSLKSELRVCTTYIHERIAQDTTPFGLTNNGIREGPEAKVNRYAPGSGSRNREDVRSGRNEDE